MLPQVHGGGLYSSGARLVLARRRKVGMPHQQRVHFDLEAGVDHRWANPR